MRISTKGRYGVRFMMDLADHEKQGNVTLRDVSRRQAISEKYLWQVVNPLKKKGLIRALAGPGGGYAIAREASTITLHDILAVLEGDNGLVVCTHEPTVCPRNNGCAAREIWKQVDERLTNILNSITLADMVDKQRAVAQKSALEYCI
ncbi:MAG: RrF2 family transcriptional regulator [Kiritimatiellia bacterium]